MKTKKNNNSNEVKQFAIGTKITYNGKLYEVVESVNCADCSLASICSNSDLSASDRNDNALSKDERIKIFGECSSFRRPDSKDIVFVEITKDTSDNKFYKITPLFTDSNHIQLRPIKFALPDGYEIDIEASDLDKGIIKFKNKWLSLEQIYNMAKTTNYHTYLSEIKDSTGDKTCEFREKLIALANLMDIARYFNDDWNYDVTKEDIGYMITYDISISGPCYTVQKINATTDVYYGNPIFKNEDNAKYVIDNPNFRNILDKIFKV